MPARILVIVMRYLGDVLLATPLIRSLRMAYPTAQLDVLVYDSTAAILAGNEDIDSIITTPLRIGLSEYLALVKRLFKRYDLAMVTQTGDRPFLYGLLAATTRVSVVPPKGQAGWWKHYFLQRWVEFDNYGTHTVLQNLQLLDLIGIPKQFGLVPPKMGKKESTENLGGVSGDYVVLHAYPQWRYKQWPLEGWSEIGRYIAGMGFKVVLSGGSSLDERNYVAEIARILPAGTINLAGKTSLARLASILAQAKLYIGPDTGITHLAAAMAIPVIALFGPTNPIKWAPWPSGFSDDANPFHKVGNQRVNNIILIQGVGSCVPCHQEGCDRHRGSHSLCLDNLTVAPIKRAIMQALAARNAAP